MHGSRPRPRWLIGALLAAAALSALGCGSQGNSAPQTAAATVQRAQAAVTPPAPSTGPSRGVCRSLDAQLQRTLSVLERYYSRRASADSWAVLARRGARDIEHATGTLDSLHPPAHALAAALLARAQAFTRLAVHLQQEPHRSSGVAPLIVRRFVHDWQRTQQACSTEA